MPTCSHSSNHRRVMSRQQPESGTTAIGAQSHTLRTDHIGLATHGQGLRASSLPAFNLASNTMNTMITNSRTLAGISVPDTPLVYQAIEYAQRECEPYLFNHVVRSWLFAL